MGTSELGRDYDMVSPKCVDVVQSDPNKGVTEHALFGSVKWCIIINCQQCSAINKRLKKYRLVVNDPV